MTTNTAFLVGSLSNSGLSSVKGLLLKTLLMREMRKKPERSRKKLISFRTADRFFSTLDHKRKTVIKAALRTFCLYLLLLLYFTLSKISNSALSFCDAATFSYVKAQTLAFAFRSKKIIQIHQDSPPS